MEQNVSKLCNGIQNYQNDRSTNPKSSSEKEIISRKVIWINMLKLEPTKLDTSNELICIFLMNSSQLEGRML